MASARTTPRKRSEKRMMAVSMRCSPLRSVLVCLNLRTKLLRKQGLRACRYDAGVGINHLYHKPPARYWIRGLNSGAHELVFLIDTTTTEIYTLPQHDALAIRP